MSSIPRHRISSGSARVCAMRTYIGIINVGYTERGARISAAGSGQSRRRLLGTRLSSRTHGTRISPPPPRPSILRLSTTRLVAPHLHTASAVLVRVRIYTYLFLSSSTPQLLYSAPRTHARALVSIHGFSKGAFYYDGCMRIRWGTRRVS